MSKLTTLQSREQELAEALCAVRRDIKVVKEQGVDVTGECKAVLLEEFGTIRLALEHKGNIIIRAGAGEAMSMTSFAQEHGYSMKNGRKATRGSFFTVSKKCC
uniref:Uncharacterized protein n=1 Tax=viral metagenome TaxID=1070528 RepID=A0A6H1ZRU4_9ZZZZ